MMRPAIAAAICALAATLPLTMAVTTPSLAQAPATAKRPAPGPIDGPTFQTRYIRLGNRNSESLLYAPKQPGAQARIALLFAHPSGNNFTDPIGLQMAQRGYYIAMVNYRGEGEADDAYAPAISQTIRYLRTLPGVEKVVLIGHSGGGHLAALYQNAAENGPKACIRPGILYPCAVNNVTDLEKPDGLVLLDSTLGAFHQASAIDPAGEKATGRNPALDMFLPANGFDLTQRSAHYGDAFIKRFHQGQQARNEKIVDQALARLSAIQDGKGQFKDDEPFVIPAMGVASSGARLYQPDTRLLSHTRAPHILLKADGSEANGIVQSVRPQSGKQTIEALGTLAEMTQNSTVRHFLGDSAIRMTRDFAITEDNITGVDWRSAMSSTPANAEGITVPTLMLAMSCHYLVVPGEIIFDHLKSADKSFAAVEGATHVFAPCKPEYGDTTKRTFDAVDKWLTKPGRF